MKGVPWVWISYFGEEISWLKYFTLSMHCSVAILVWSDVKWKVYLVMWICWISEIISWLIIATCCSFPILVTVLYKMKGISNRMNPVFMWTNLCTEQFKLTISVLLVVSLCAVKGVCTIMNILVVGNDLKTFHASYCCSHIDHCLV